MSKIDLSGLADLASAGKVKTVIVAATDMQGRLFGKRLTVNHFLERAHRQCAMCSNNLLWDMELNVGDFALASRKTGLPDILVRPDLDTIRWYPWFDNTVICLAGLFNRNGSPVTVDPRHILERQLKKARDLGIEVMMGSELEFYVYNETNRSARKKNYYDLQPLNDTVGESLYVSSCEEWFIQIVREQMQGAGIPVEGSRSERGNSQVEINLQYCDVMEMADRTVIYKNGLKEMAFLNNLLVTFMAKYRDDEPGSSFHVHISLWADGKNVLYDPQGEYELSARGKQFLAGMLQLAPEFMPFYAPNINSYKRYKNTFGAPINVSWGFDNRTTAFRVLGDKEGKRIENRISGADANPYLVLAACLASGLRGVENEWELKENPQFTTAYDNRTLRALPDCLPSALEAFTGSRAAEESLGKDVVEHYAAAGANEIDNFSSHVTDWERKRYLEQT